MTRLKQIKRSLKAVIEILELDTDFRASYYGVMRQVDTHNDNQENKPLTEPVFLILASLADQPRHGYALMQDIQQISNDRVTLSTGTLYGALRRLLEEGLIERFQQKDKSRDKQAYKITIEGRRQLQLEINRMKQLMRIAASRMKDVEA